MAKQLKGTLGSWQLDIEETKRLSDKEILVFYDSKTKKKVYTKLMPEKDLEKGLFFEILSASELEGIVETVEIEESYNKTLESKSSREILIEESAENSEAPYGYHGDGRPITKTEHEEYERKKQVGNVTINITGAKPKEGSKLEGVENPSEIEDFNLAEKKIEAYKQFNDTRFLEAQTKEELKDMVTQVVKEASEIRKGKTETPSGVAVINDAQRGIQPQKVGFDSVEDLIRSLRKAENSGSSEAKLIIDELFRKWEKGQRKLGLPIKEYGEDLNPMEELEKTKPTDKRLEHLAEEEIEALRKKRSKKPHPKSAVSIEVVK